jgi:hypothetical protein
MKHRLAIVVASAPFVLAACGGSPQAQVAPPDPARTVTGMVLASDGRALAHAALRVGDLLTTTDEAGRFSVANAPPEYDVTLTRELDNIVFSFQGLSQRDPTLWLYEASPAPFMMHTANVHVTAPAPENDKTKTLYFADLRAPSAASLSLHAEETAGAVDLAFAWSATSAVDVTVYALRYETDGATAYATRYSGLTSTAMHLGEGQADTWTIASFDPVATKSIVTQVAFPNEVSLEDAVFGMELGVSLSLTLLPVRPPSASATIELVPDLPDASFVLAALGTPPGRALLNGPYTTSRVSMRASETMAIRLPSPITLVAPEAAATDVAPDAEFSWRSSQAAQTELVRFEPDILTPVVAPQVYVQTKSGHAHLPDATDLGVRSPHGAKYTWQVLTPSWMPELGHGMIAEARAGRGEGEQSVSVSEKRTFDLAASK